MSDASRRRWPTRAPTLLPTDTRAAATRLDTVLAAWSGEPLRDLPPTDAVRGVVVRLRELRCSAEDDRVDALLASGEPNPSFVADLEAAVADEPLREHRWAQLMIAPERSGRTADALRSFQRAR